MRSANSILTCPELHHTLSDNYPHYFSYIQDTPRAFLIGSKHRFLEFTYINA